MNDDAEEDKFNVHWIGADGTETTEHDVSMPTHDKMKAFVMGGTEHISVLYNGVECSMFVNEVGRGLWTDRNPTAIEIYFAMARAQGRDPEDKDQEERDLLDMADRMGIPHENIVRMDIAPEQPPGIYGPAILLEGFTRR